MRLITSAELAHRSEQDLAALFARISRDLPATRPGSAERRNALASLDNIRRALASRRAGPAL